MMSSLQSKVFIFSFLNQVAGQTIYSKSSRTMPPLLLRQAGIKNAFGLTFSMLAH
jgi:hypothetical protein